MEMWRFTPFSCGVPKFRVCTGHPSDAVVPDGIRLLQCSHRALFGGFRPVADHNLQPVLQRFLQKQSVLIRPAFIMAIEEESPWPELTTMRFLFPAQPAFETTPG